MKKYSIIYIDPPWPENKRDNKNTKFGTGAHKYNLMTIEAIKAYPIAQMSKENCALFMWITTPKQKYMMEILDAWGFRFVNKAFCWVKVNKKDGKPRFGIGNYTKSNTEDCWLAVKGKMSVVSNYVSQVVMQPISEHSKKPDIVRDRIVELFGKLPRVEVFARKRHKGWDAIGDQL